MIKEAYSCIFQIDKVWPSIRTLLPCVKSSSIQLTLVSQIYKKPGHCTIVECKNICKP